MTTSSIDKLIPGLAIARIYRREWLTSDLLAGLSVAAVALPIGIAYAQLAGFPPVIGIYSSILPLLTYALFGSSRQLMVNPDGAACAIVASTVAPLAAGNPDHYLDLAIALTILTGLLCIAGGFLGLGAIANFLSRPILTGYLNGIALTIIVGQLGKLLGFDVISEGFFRTLAAVMSRLGETHVSTAALGVSLFVLLLTIKRLFPRVPGPLIAAVAGIGGVFLLGLHEKGVAVVGNVPGGLPQPRMPAIDQSELPPLLFGAGGIVLVSFCSMMTTARGFAEKNGYSIDANKDMIALGVCDIASGLSRGFVVSGADSRTAVADSSGGKTQLTGIVAALVMAVVLLFLTAPLALLPTAALAAILVSAAIGLFDFASLRRYYKLSKPEFRQAMVAMLGVMTVGVLPGVLIAVGLALLKLVEHGSHPNDAVLGVVERDGGYFFDDEKGDGRAIRGLLIYRFDASLVFFNADHFKGRVMDVISESVEKPRWFLLDAEAIPVLDVTGAEALGSVHSNLRERGIVMAIARGKGVFRTMLERSGVAGCIGDEYLFPTVRCGARAYLAVMDDAQNQKEGAERRREMDSGKNFGAVCA